MQASEGYDAVTSAATIAREISFACVETAGFVLEQQGLAILGICVSGQITHISPKARQYFKHDLYLVAGRLAARRPKNAAAFDKLLQGICSPQASDERHYLVLLREDSQMPLVLCGCILPDLACNILRPTVALLEIFDPGRAQSPPARLLMQYFNLTPAESRLAAALASGESPEAYAKTHAVSVVTVRNQLQSLLRKTGTHRQGELVARLHRVMPLA